ncbi:uncharacterized protein LOC141900864 [Tubulanus polymorphus]|uniref:uncharacterized protein LOC141900864 n=1 Tax=Tubulanus polymorphus TaxID=672921 RepID=UPI003DA23C00
MKKSRWSRPVNDDESFKSGISRAGNIMLSKDTISSSVSSLTPSQLNAAILNLLNISPESGRFVCQGDPLTTKGKRIQVLKILSTVSIPLLILLGLTANVFSGMLKAHKSLQSVRDIVYHGAEIGSLIHQLQRERDVSSLYISVIGPSTKKRLINQYPLTDNAIANLSFWSSDGELISDRPEFKNRETFQNYLNRHRYRLDTANSTLVDELLFYTENNEILLKWLSDSVSDIRTGDLWTLLVAYLELLQAKDSFGLERGLGIIYFVRGGFPTYETYLQFLYYQDDANITFESARLFSPLVMEMYRETIRGNDSFFEQINEFRIEARENNLTTKPNEERAEIWYSLMSLYIDHLFDTSVRLRNKILAVLDERLDNDLANIVIIALVFAIVIILCPVILNAVYELTSSIQGYSLNLADRTKALNREKKRTDTLLYQMLPKQVAEQLKNNMEVKAESFSDVTIFFSDIVGFTQISARSSPIQVVQMLNSLYTCFDKRIELYDVYKVETIGDAYMVASGLPTRNGRRHSAEIGTMALDLLDQIALLEIPHLPGTVFQLRIGCHTGPVVAGIVGSKMPRYCLFGESVTIASKMESLGVPGKIHMSWYCYSALDALGGFVMSCREEDVVVDDLVLTKAMEGETATYWLLDRIGRRQMMPRLADDGSDLATTSENDHESKASTPVHQDTNSGVVAGTSGVQHR